MKLSLLLAGLLVAASATSAMAAGNYIEGSIGPSFFHDSDINEGGFLGATASYDTGFGFSVGGGHKFDSGWRVEGEFGFKRADVSSLSNAGFSNTLSASDASVMSFLCNGFYDFKTNSAATPFLGGGLGSLRGKLTIGGQDYNDTVIGYQLSAGVAFQVNKNVDLTLLYRFEGAGPDFRFAGSDVPYHSSNILVGARYTIY